MIKVFSSYTQGTELLNLQGVLEIEWLGSGEMTKLFVEKFSEYVRVLPSSLLPVSSCSDAIYVALTCLELQPNDEVIIPSIHYSGVASYVIQCGGIPVICDVNEHDLNIDVSKALNLLNKRTRAIFVNHYGGYPCDLIQLKKKIPSDVMLIEDAATALCTDINGSHCGTIGDIGMWSFNPVKQIATPSGGMLYFKHEYHINYARSLVNLGSPQVSGFSNSTYNTNDRWWRFDVKHPYGISSPFNDVSATFALCQLKRLGTLIRDVTVPNFELYCNSLSGVGDIILPPDIETDTSWIGAFFFFIKTKHRNELSKHLFGKGVYTTFRYYPIHKMSLFSKFCNPSDFPISNKVCDETLLLPFHFSLEKEECLFVINSIKEFFG